MKNRNIVIIFIIIIVLSLVYLKQRSSEMPVSKQGGGYSKILPDKFSPDDVKKIKLYQGIKEENAILLERNTTGDDNWRVVNVYNAKGNKQLINNLLIDLKNLDGEERASSKDVFSDFGIGDVEAMHLVLSGSDKELFHLLIGKVGPSFSDGFLRFKDKDNTYLVNKNIRSSFGVFGNDNEKPLDSKRWIERKIFDLNKDSISKITYNDVKRIVIEKRPKDIIETAPKSTEIKPNDNQPKVEEEKKIIYEWVINEPINSVVKEDQIDPILNSLANLMEDDVADPERIAEYGFSDSKTFLILQMEDKKEYKLLTGKKEDGKYYVVLDGDNVVYKIEEQKYKNAFEKIDGILKTGK